ncbi:TnpV protein [uncultured Oscillibacter sp.]|uniref:TnpV protein n=1 Tax=uncultured Oscillibacter sp. TaxID=876091 RepID=UPI00260CDF02|nr:TnpV protein [uncultured Oscillibacter sp.]
MSVLDYKKQEREKEVIQLEGQISEKKEEFQALSDRVENYDKGIENLKTLEQMLDTSPEYQLPEPQGFMSAKSYKNKVAEDLFSRLVKEYADRQGVTEQLKAENQILWVQKMNNIRACVREIVENEVIYL